MISKNQDDKNMKKKEALKCLPLYFLKKWRKMIQYYDIELRKTVDFIDY